ncbi:MAG: hypothetical protein ABSA90_03400 [Xanthobacteraceae bacterium]|jgi:hypothetical protein
MMSATRRISSQPALFGASGPELSAVTDGEINFLWSFIQGSIMVPQTRGTLLRGYGFCERHAWIHISVEMSFRDQYLLGPTILYSELIEKSLRAIAPERIGLHSLMRRLAAVGPCFLCALDVKNASAGACPQARLDQGRDGSRLQDFAGELQPIWRSSLCPDCSGRERGRMAPKRCRQHLLAAMKARTPVDLVAQKAMLEDLSDRVARYQRSFSAGGPKASDRDRAALIAAIGWCSGWRPLLARLSREAAAPNA